MLRQGTWWIIFAFWLVFFFPQWYFITYTKVWELRRLIGQPTEQQIRVLHSPEMDILIAAAERTKQDDAAVIVPPAGSYPLLSASALWRYFLNGSHTIFSPTTVPSGTKRLIVLVPARERDWRPLQMTCQQGGCSCLNWPVDAVFYWRVP